MNLIIQCMLRVSALLVFVVLASASCSHGPTPRTCGYAVANPPGSASAKQPHDLSSLKAKRDEFVRRVETLGFELPYTPEMRLWTRPSIISWREEARAVAVPEWDQLDPKVKQLLEGWTSDGRAMTLFNRAFRWFFPMHELTHFLQTEFGGCEGHSRCEREANDMAVAFLVGPGEGETAGWEKLVDAAVERSVALPGDDDPDAWFDRNYHEMRERPKVYAAYQWGFVKDSLSRGAELEFDEMVTGVLTRNGHPTAVMLAPQLDVGFHVAAHLHLPDVAITLHDPKYVERVELARKDMKFPSTLLKDLAPSLSTSLNERWRVHRLVRVPALFPDFADTKTAFRLLLGDDQSGPANEVIRRRLEPLLKLYPSLRELSGEDLELARVLTGLIITQYDGFYVRWVAGQMHKWDPARRAFRDAWYEQITPALALLDPDRKIRQVVIVLSPALRRHGKSYRVADGIGRVAALLPVDPAELPHALLYAFHEMCHGISDDLVFAAGFSKVDLSYKQGDSGKQLHALIEHAANQAMFESLNVANPELLAEFLAGFGSLQWLAEADLLAEHARFAGHAPGSKQLGEFEEGLESNPVETSRLMYEEGILVPAETLKALRARTRQAGETPG